MVAKKKHKRELNVPRILREIRLYLLVFFVFSMPLFFLPGNSEYGYTKSIYALVFVSLLYGLWGAEAWLRREWTLDITWGGFLIAAFIIASLFSLLGTTPAGVVIQSAVLVLFFGLLGILVANSVSGDREVRWILTALLCAGVLNGLFGLLQYLGVVLGGAPGGGLNAVIATMGNRNFLGGFLSYLFLPCAALLLLVRRHWQRALAIGGLGFVLAIALFVRQTGVRLGLAIAGLFLSFVSGYWGLLPRRKEALWWLGLYGTTLAAVGSVVGARGLLGALIYSALGAILFLWGKVLRRLRIVWIPTVALALLAIFLLNPATTPLSAVERAWERNAGRVRAWDWWVGYFMWKDHPFTGIGLGGYKIHFVPYKPEFLSSPVGQRYRFPIARAAQAHNEYVQVAAELGVLGIIVLLGGIGLVSYLWTRRMGEAGRRELKGELSLLAAGLIAFLIHATVSFPWHRPSGSLVFVVVLGALLSSRYGRVGRFPVVLRGRLLKGTVAFVAVLGLGVSVMAVRDLLADRYLQQGKLAYFRGDLRTAYPLLQRAVSWDFFPRISLYWLGLVQMEMGLRDQALESFYRCLDGRYVHEALYLNIAALELERGNLDAAVRAAEELIATAPPRDMKDAAQYIVAIARYRGGDIPQAVEILKGIVKRSPDFERGWALLGEIAQSTGDFEEARSYYQRALKVIEKKISRIEKRLTGPLTPENFGKLRSELKGLKAWQKLVKERLENLP